MVNTENTDAPTQEDRAKAGRAAAQARWGVKTPAAYVESAGYGVLTNHLARESLAPFSPVGASGPIDLVIADEIGRARAVQLKAIAGGGLTVWTKYLGLRLHIVYVTLGREVGGSARQTLIRVLTPEQACKLAFQFSGQRNEDSRYDPERHGTYRWPRETAQLRQALEPYTVRQVGDLTRLLGLD